MFGYKFKEKKIEKDQQGQLWYVSIMEKREKASTKSIDEKIASLEAQQVRLAAEKAVLEAEK